jgi:hypothetical protein
MKVPQSLRAWLSFALLFVVVAVPAYADPTSDLFALFNQANGVAASNGLDMGERVSLVTKIIASIASLERDQETTAMNQLGAFINEVEALERSNRLPSEDAQALADAATAIIDQL